MIVGQSHPRKISINRKILLIQAGSANYIEAVLNNRYKLGIKKRIISGRSPILRAFESIRISVLNIAVADEQYFYHNILYPLISSQALI